MEMGAVILCGVLSAMMCMSSLVGTCGGEIAGHVLLFFWGGEAFGFGETEGFFGWRFVETMGDVVGVGVLEPTHSIFSTIFFNKHYTTFYSHLPILVTSCILQFNISNHELSKPHYRPTPATPASLPYQKITHKIPSNRQKPATSQFVIIVDLPNMLL